MYCGGYQLQIRVLYAEILFPNSDGMFLQSVSISNQRLGKTWIKQKYCKKNILLLKRFLKLELM